MVLIFLLYACISSNSTIQIFLLYPWFLKTKNKHLNVCIYYVPYYPLFICCDKTSWLKQLREEKLFFFYFFTQLHVIVHHCQEAKTAGTEQLITSSGKKRMKVSAEFLVFNLLSPIFYSLGFKAQSMVLPTED